MKRSLSLATVVLVLAASLGQAGEIGFIEDFALAKDRTIPLKQLIPGTEAHYYYHCLYYQQNEQYDKVAQTLSAWIERHGQTQLVKEIQYRQALLTYEQEPAKSLAFIQRELGLTFSHQRETLGFKPNLPTKLDQNRIGRDALSKIAFARHENLDGFEDSALDWLVGVELNPEDRRHLIQRLGRPDFEKLTELVVADLNHQFSGGFGSANIHRQLLLSQLDDLLKRKPDLLNQTHFVNAYLSKLHPAADVDWQHDAPAREAYLDRLWSFVSTLAPAHNSLKAHVVYQRLAHDRNAGVYDKERFMTYLALPRYVSYIEAEFMKRETSQQFPADLNVDFHAFTLLPPVGDDEPLVRSYLHHFFVKETTYKPYTEWINDLYLKHNFAEAKIVNGLGEPEQWYSMLPPDRYQALKERIDLDFAFTNKRLFAPDEPVSLELSVKNVPSLIVKVYEVNAGNYYRDNLREVDTDVNLDGLVANSEKTYEYKEPPLRRVKRQFDFPQCEGRGVYVIDFIGNGTSSRALVRKGKFRFLAHTSTAGHAFTVLDEANRQLNDATLWLSGIEYKADKDGVVNVPFSNQPGRQPIVLSHGGDSSLDEFQHESENYSLAAGIYVDRQSLLDRKKAQVVVRPSLYLNGVPVSLALLEKIKLAITATDQDGISSTKEVADFKLFEDREATYEFATPARLQRIAFTLRAKVKNLSQNQDVDVAAGQTFELNGIDRTEKTEDLHLANISGDYVIDVLGKSGEVKGNRQINLAIKHRDFRDTVNVSLQSDDAGRLNLGPLVDIASVTATGPQATAHTWQLRDDAHSQYRSLHGVAGGAIAVPFMAKGEQASRDEVSLLELRGDTFVSDRFDAVSVKDGLLRVSELPRGDYDLLLKRSGARIKLRLSEGESRQSYVLSENRQLELRGAAPLQIKDVKVAADAVTVELTNATKFARVHVFASRYQPAFAAFDYLSGVPDAEPYVVSLPKPDSLYIAGRNIGDEYRYIIDRQYAKRYPGVMVERPSLLLNPWAIRTTETGQQDAEPGAEFAAAGDSESGAVARDPSAMPHGAAGGDFANLDFLSEGTAVIVNAAPDENGVIQIDRELLGANQHIHIVACDPTSTAYRAVSLAERVTKSQDLRLLSGLDPAQHFTQQKQITVVKPQGDFALADITTSRFEAYDNLARVYALYATLSQDPKLLEFSFILGWHKLKAEEKQTLYSKHACHELAFFIQQKDPQFFNDAIKPYLAHKKDKTFLDHYLLGDDLDDYRNPWNHAQLNIVERILLAQLVKDEQPHTARHVGDLFNLVPPNVDRFNLLFNTALQGSALETSDQFGFAGAKQAEVEKVAKEMQERFGDLADLKQAGASAGFGPRGGANGKELNELAASKMPTDAPPTSEAAPAKPSPKRDEAEKGEADAKYRNGEDLQRGRRQLERNNDAEAFYAKDMAKREEVRQYYRKLDKTMEWVENNYYKLAIQQQNAELVTANAFWNDYAQHPADGAFYSIHLAEASRNFTEMMFALSVLDIPFEAPEHESKFDGIKMTLKAGGPIVAYHEEIKPTRDLARQTPILVSQNFFHHTDRYLYENNERYDKYISDEFLIHTPYGCQVVVTNPTSSPRKLDVLVQIPVGAMPLLVGKQTNSIHVQLAPYNTQTFEFFFYFPAAGQFKHYPVHVAQNEQLVAFGEPFAFNVVAEATKIDRESWAFISQHGSSEDVLRYLGDNNLNRTDLDKIAFRMQEKKFFETVTELLRQRHVYNHTLWSYGVKHNVVAPIREFLRHENNFVAQCGDYLLCTLLAIDPVVRKTYEHMEYKPLVNARAHQLGRRRQILNDRFEAQYNRLLKVLGYRRELNDDDLMAVTYYLFLQDRIEEGLDFFSRVNADALSTRLQYDYCGAYAALYLEDTGKARDIAARYANHPVDRWRNAFVTITTQLDEIETAKTAVVDDENRNEVQTNLAATQPNFDFNVEAKKITLAYQNLNKATVNYYLMDIELLFSRNPFVQQYTGQFSYITPNRTDEIELKADATSHAFDLPEEFHNSNVLVEISATGQKKSQAYYSNSLSVQTIENYGQVRVTNAGTLKPIPKTYVKVYAQMQDGAVKFYKDGYTDLRGRFDYTSLNTNELDFVNKFSLLILSDTNGAIVREANPPKR